MDNTTKQLIKQDIEIRHLKAINDQLVSICAYAHDMLLGDKNNLNEANIHIQDIVMTLKIALDTPKTKEHK